MRAMSDSAPPAIEARGLGKSYRSRAHGVVDALRGFDLTLAAGESTGLIGPNGSGKSTAIQLILGLIGADRGTIRIFGERPDSVAARQRLGYLPEESALFPFLTARETLDVVGRLHGFDRRARRARSDELLDALGLTAAARRPVATYSKGMARRVAFGRAIFHRPSVLVLDEPTSGLDPDGADVLFRMVGECMAEGAAVVFSTHMLREAEARARHFTLLFNGAVRGAGPLDALLAESGAATLPDLFHRLLAESRS